MTFNLLSSKFGLDNANVIVTQIVKGHFSSPCFRHTLGFEIDVLTFVSPILTDSIPIALYR